MIIVPAYAAIFAALFIFCLPARSGRVVLQKLPLEPAEISGSNALHAFTQILPNMCLLACC